MRKIIVWLVNILMISIILIVGYFTIFVYRNETINFVLDNILFPRKIIIKEGNEYTRNKNYLYVQKTDNFIATSKQDMYNIFYSILDNGWDEFTFYCDRNYINCNNDLNEFTIDGNNLSILNNYVHPYNTFNNVDISNNVTLNKITINVTKQYSSDIIAMTNNKLNSVFNSIIKSNDTTRNKIKAAHDYIIKNSSYDQEKAKKIEQNIKDDDNMNLSHIAYGPLLQNKAICSGYTDAMALFLDKLNVENYKISTLHHVWNLVKVDDKWLHIDLTWNDPIYDDGSERILHKYFLIDNNTLISYNTNEHNYPKGIYLETEK